MGKTELSRGKLTGERGLLTAVIQQALKDEIEGNNRRRVDARRYFASEHYATHLELLDLPRTFLPREFEHE